MWPNGRRQHSLDGPPCAPSCIHDVPRDAGDLAPFSNEMRFACVRQVYVSRSVTGLCSSCAPSYIPRLVVACAFDSVERVAGARLGADIMQEGGKVVPPLRNRDALGPVVSIVRTHRAQTSFAHVQPVDVLGRPFVSAPGRSAVILHKCIVPRDEVVVN